MSGFVVSGCLTWRPTRITSVCRSELARDCSLLVSKDVGCTSGIAFCPRCLVFTPASHTAPLTPQLLKRACSRFGGGDHLPSSISGGLDPTNQAGEGGGDGLPMIERCSGAWRRDQSAECRDQSAECKGRAQRRIRQVCAGHEKAVAGATAWGVARISVEQQVSLLPASRRNRWSRCHANEPWRFSQCSWPTRPVHW